MSIYLFKINLHYTVNFNFSINIKVIFSRLKIVPLYDEIMFHRYSA